MMGRLNGMIFEGAPVRDSLSISVRLKQNPKTTHTLGKLHWEFELPKYSAWPWGSQPPYPELSPSSQSCHLLQGTA